MAPNFKTNSIKQRFQLISAVKEFPVLYEPQLLACGSEQSRDKIWKTVALKCDIKSGQIAKALFTKIYENYFAYRKNPKQNERNRYNVFFNSLSFMDPFIDQCKEGEHLYNHSDSNSLASSQCNDRDISEITAVLNQTAPLDSSREFTTVQYWNENDDDIQNDTSEIVESINHQPMIKPNPDDDDEIISPEEVEAIKRNHNRSLRMFFDAMYASTSQLSPALQRLVKMKIFTAVVEAEEQADLENEESIA